MKYAGRVCLQAGHRDRRESQKGRLLSSARFLLFCMLATCPAASAQSANLPDLSAQGQAALKAEQFDRAEKIYEQMVKLDPRSAEAHSNLGLALYMQGSYPHAISELKKALELAPHLDHARVMLALSYFNSGDLQRAIPLLEKAYQANKDDSVVAAHLGLGYLKLEQDDKALAVLTHWAELEPNSADALYFKGKASLYVASNAFVNLTKLAPDSFRMFQLRAEMLRQQNLVPAAIDEYKKAIAQKPDAAGLHYALGTLYRENGRLDEALAEFNEELKISPGDAMTDYLIGDVYLQQNHLESAEQYLTQALQRQPTLADAQLDLAKTYQAQGKTDLAVQELQSVLAADPAQQSAHYMLFKLYRDQGLSEKAQQELRAFEALKQKTADEEKRMRLDSLD